MPAQRSKNAGLVRAGDILEDLFQQPDFAYLAPVRPSPSTPIGKPSADKLTFTGDAPPRSIDVVIASAIILQIAVGVGGLAVGSDIILMTGNGVAWAILAAAAILEGLGLPMMFSTSPAKTLTSSLRARR